MLGSINIIDGVDMYQNTDGNGHAFGFVDGWFINYSLNGGKLQFSLEQDEISEDEPGDRDEAETKVRAIIDRLEAQEYSAVLSEIISTLK